jgi:hypothetical protein
MELLTGRELRQHAFRHHSITFRDRFIDRVDHALPFPNLSYVRPSQKRPSLDSGSIIILASNEDERSRLL